MAMIAAAPVAMVASMRMTCREAMSDGNLRKCSCGQAQVVYRVILTVCRSYGHFNWWECVGVVRKTGSTHRRFVCGLVGLDENLADGGLLAD